MTSADVAYQRDLAQMQPDEQWKESMPYWWYRCNNTEKKEKTSKEHDAVVAADGSDTRGASAANFAERRHNSWKKMLFVALPLRTTTTAMATQRILAAAMLQDIDSFNFYRSLA